jgi:hypothetical protein
MVRATTLLPAAKIFNHSDAGTRHERNPYWIVRVLTVGCRTIRILCT